MKKHWTKVLTCFLLIGTLLFAACNDLLTPPEDTSPVEEGKGTVEVKFDAGVTANMVRKVLPSAVFDNYEFTFISQDSGPLDSIDKTSGESLTFVLDPGIYTLQVKAYKGEKSDANLAATGSSGSFTLSANGSAPVFIRLDGIVTSGSAGVFSYTIKYPAGAVVDLFTLGVADIKAGTASTAGGVTTLTKTIDNVAAGNYIVVVNLSMSDGSEAGDADFVVISKDLTSFYTVEFTSGDFKSSSGTNENIGTTVTSWNGFTINQNGGARSPTGTLYAAYTDSTGTYTDVLKIAAPSGGYTSYDGYALYRANINGTVNISMQAWVEKTVDEDVYVYWQGRGTGYPADAAASGTPLGNDQFGKWIYIEQAFTTTSSIPIALMGSNSSTADDSKGLRHATIYIRDLRLSVNGSMVAGTPVAVESIAIDPAGPLTIEADLTQQLNLVFTPANATNKTVTWTSSSTAVAAVSSLGLIQPVSAGTTTITAATEDGGKTASVDVTVTPAPLRVTITAPSADPLTIGDKRKLTAAVTGGAYSSIVWSSSNTNIARVAEDGTVRGIGYSGSEVTSTETATGDNTGSIKIFTGTGTATITASARDASNKELAKAAIEVNTTTAAQTAYTNSSNASAYFNFGAKFQDYFIMGQTAGPSNSTLASMGFTVVTPGSQMKPDALCRNGFKVYDGGKTSGTMNWYNFTSSNGVKLHGHTLLWHQWNQIAEWMHDEGVNAKAVITDPEATAEQKLTVRENAIEDLRVWIKTVVEHYNGQTASWDVLNEAFTGNHSDRHWTETGTNPSTTWRNYLRRDDETANAADHPHPWWWSIGPDYVWYAFFYARQYADEGTTLYYNDYNLDTEVSKVNAVIEMIKELNARYETYKQENPGAKLGNLIDGIGMQAHFNSTSSAGGIGTALQRFRQNNVKVVISELTVMPYDYSSEYAKARFVASDSSAYTHFEMLPNFAEGNEEGGELGARRQMEQALMFAQAFKAYVDYADVIDRVSIFGLNSNISSWRPFLLPFDNNSRGKPAAYAIMDYEQFIADHTGTGNNTNSQWPKISSDR
jgi:GH35 family endo-1,4-beta-xylanase